MDTNRVRYFLTLAKTGSITKSAELHRISAPAFSKAIKVFEAEMNRPLTLPHGRGIVLTDFAKSLVPKLSAVIEQMDALTNSIQPLRQDQKILRVATFEVFSTLFMARAISESFADYDCEIRECLPGRMEEAIASGRSDLGLTYQPIPHPELDFLRICKTEMAIYGRPTLLNRSLEELPFAVPISPIEGSPTKVRGLDGWPDDRIPRRIKYRVDMLQTALDLCAEGAAVAYLPSFVVHLHNKKAQAKFQLSPREMEKPVRVSNSFVYLIKRKSDEEGTTAKKLAKVVRALCTA